MMQNEFDQTDLDQEDELDQLNPDAASPSTTKRSKFFQENGFERIAQFETPDGRRWNTQAAAAEHMRVFLVKEALVKLVGDQVENADQLVEWLFENREQLREALDAAKRERARTSMSDEAKATNAARLAAAREKGSVLSLLNSPDTDETLKEGLRAKLVAIEAKLIALSPKKAQEVDRDAVIAAAS
jgi:hypothetical protein